MRLAAPSVAIALATHLLACSSAKPLPGGPPPEFEPGRALALPSQSEPRAASRAPAAIANEPSAGTEPAPSGSGPQGSTRTSTDVQLAPVTPGAGDPVPADGRLGAKHLVVMYKGSQRAPHAVTRSKDEAKKRAEECSHKAKAPGAAWEKVVSECTDEPHGGERGGDLYTFPPQAMAAEFTKAVLDLKVGQTSGVVETPFGFHVIVRTK